MSILCFVVLFLLYHLLLSFTLFFIVFDVCMTVCIPWSIAKLFGVLLESCVVDIHDFDDLVLDDDDSELVKSF